jgi:uncharacterized membrane protein YagU involved in acid resistance
MDDTLASAEARSRLVEEPSENESGVALNIAIINGVVDGLRRIGLEVGMMGKRVSG